MDPISKQNEDNGPQLNLLGVDNRRKDESLPRGFVRDAVNVDFTASGLRTRAGYTKVKTLTNGRGLVANETFMVYVDSGQLIRLDQNLTPTVLDSGLPSNLPLVTAVVNNAIYFCCGTRQGIVTATGYATGWNGRSESYTRGDGFVAYVEPLPAGEILYQWHGRLYVVVGSVLLYSRSLDFGVYEPDRHFVMFPGQITNVVGNDAGLLVAVDGDNTYQFQGGDIEGTKQQFALPYGGVRGTTFAVTNTNTVGFMSPRGPVMMDNDGKITNPIEDHIAPRNLTSGAVGILEREGARTLIASGRPSGDASDMTVSDFVEVEIIRSNS